MKIVKITGDASGRVGFQAQPGAYDAAPPIDTWFLDAAPMLESADRLAVAATIVFGPYVSGVLELPKACGPTTASAIQRYLAPVPVTVSPVDLEPRALPVGAGVCVAAEGEEEVGMPDNHRDARRTHVVKSLRSDRFAGSLASMSDYRVATNGWLHGRDSSALQQRAGSIATAVLFAESVLCDEIRVPVALPEGEDVTRLSYLLSAVRLGLSCGVVL